MNTFKLPDSLNTRKEVYDAHRKRMQFLFPDTNNNVIRIISNPNLKYHGKELDYKGHKERLEYLRKTLRNDVEKIIHLKIVK